MKDNIYRHSMSLDFRETKYSNFTINTEKSNKGNFKVQNLLTTEMILNLNRLKMENSITNIKKKRCEKLKKFHFSALHQTISKNNKFLTIINSANTSLNKAKERNMINLNKTNYRKSYFSLFNEYKKNASNNLLTFSDYGSSNKNNINSCNYYSPKEFLTSIHTKNVKSSKNIKKNDKKIFIEPLINVAGGEISKVLTLSKLFWRNNYMLRIKQNECKKLKELRVNEIENIEERYNKLMYIMQLFRPFIESIDKYLKYLEKEILNGITIRDKLKEKRINLVNEIFTLTLKLQKVIKTFEGYLNDKYFLLCVKNKTLKFDEFSEEDKNEYNNDLKILILINNKLRDKIIRREKHNSALNENSSNASISNNTNNNNTSNKEIQSPQNKKKTERKKAHFFSMIKCSKKKKNLYKKIVE